MRKTAYPARADARSCKVPNLRVFNLTLNNVLKTVHTRDRKELFTVEYHGHKFNALPFLINGANYFDNVCYSWLVFFIANKLPPMRNVKVADIYRAELIDEDVMHSLLPGEDGKRELYALLYIKDPELFVKLMYRCAARVLNTVVIDMESKHIPYKAAGLCNTQAFCFYLPIYWLINLDPEMRKQIEPDIKRSKFLETLDGTCPEDSIHFRYINGELTPKQLRYEYSERTFEDGSTIANREVYSNLTRGRYDGSPLDEDAIGICNWVFDGGSLSSEEIYLNRFIADAYVFHGKYEAMGKEIDLEKSKSEKLESDNYRLKQRYNKMQAEVQALRCEKSEFKAQISKLSSEIASHKTDDELRKRISQLEENLQQQTSEANELFDERLELRQELSRRAKEIKRLQARLAELGDAGATEGSDLNDGVVEADTVSLDVMIEALKDKRIVVIGGDRSKSLTKTFEDWGFTHFINQTGSVRTVDCDFIVICTILCSHKDVRQAERWVKGQDTELLYVPAVNAEMMLKALWDAMG